MCNISKLSDEVSKYTGRSDTEAVIYTCRLFRVTSARGVKVSKRIDRASPDSRCCALVQPRTTMKFHFATDTHGNLLRIAPQVIPGIGGISRALQIRMITCIIIMTLRGEDFTLCEPSQFSDRLIATISVTVVNRHTSSRSGKVEASTGFFRPSIRLSVNK